jgi:hypothetical protein
MKSMNTWDNRGELQLRSGDVGCRQKAINQKNLNNNANHEKYWNIFCNFFQNIVEINKKWDI